MASLQILSSRLQAASPMHLFPLLNIFFALEELDQDSVNV